MVPEVSIVTVNFNNSAGLDRTAKSVRALTFSNTEWIVVDGGSKDNSVEVAELYGPKVIVSEPDLGIYDAMNKGIALASGRLVIFMNSGDEFFDNHSLDFISTLDSGKQMIHSDALFVDGEKTYLLRSRVGGQMSFLIESLFCHQATLYDLESARQIGGYALNLPIAGDYDFIYRYVRRFGAIRHNAVMARFELGGISSSRKLQSMKERLECLRANGPFHLYLLLIILTPLRFLKSYIVAMMEATGAIWHYRRIRDNLRGSQPTLSSRGSKQQ